MITSARSRRASIRARLTGIAPSPADCAIVLALWAGLAVFIIYPIVGIFLRSLGLSDAGITLAHYAHAVTRYRSSMIDSVMVALATSTLCTVCSLLIALSISTLRSAMRTVSMAMLLITMISPPFVSALAYIQLYGRRGWVTYRLLGISWDPYNAVGVILMQTLSFIPIGALFLQSILSKIDTACFNAARDLGASRSYALCTVILPQMKAGILAAFLLNFVRSLSDFGTPTIIGGRFATLASDIYLQLIGSSDLELSSAMNMFLLLPSLIMFFVYRRMMSSMPHGTDEQASIDARITDFGLIGAASIAASAVFYVATMLQYGCIFISGFIKMRRGEWTLTLEHLEKLLMYDTSTLIRSVEYALIVAVAGTIFAMLCSYYVERRKIPLRGLMDCAASLPYMIPGTCFGIGYIIAFSRGPIKLTGTAAIVVLNMLFKQLPTTTRICSAMLSRIPPSLELAARDLGGGRIAVLRDIVLPLMRPAACFVYNFSSSMTTAGAIIFLIDPGSKVAVFKLFDAAYVGEYAIASLTATIIILTVLVVEGASYLILKNSRSSICT